MYIDFKSMIFFLIRAIIQVVLSTAIIAAIIMFLWNWQIVTLGIAALTYWQCFVIVGIIQFIRIKI